MPVLSITGKVISRKEASKGKISKKKKKSKLAHYKKQTVAEVSKDFYRWKKSNNYKNWRTKQWKRQAGKCFYCLSDLRDAAVNIEHVTPRSKGGTNSRRNLVLACWKCNKDKGSDMPDKKWISLAKEVSYQKAIAYEDDDIDLSWIV